MKTEQKDSTRHLSRIVGVSEKTHASSNVEHDSMKVIHRYIPNSSANEAIERFAAGLAFGGSAISITGPYGSGKSTFGVMLNCLAAPDDDGGFVKALERIDGVYDDVAYDIMEGRATAGIRKTGMIRCVVTARPEPVATTILRAIINGVESYFGTVDYDNLGFHVCRHASPPVKDSQGSGFGINHRRDYKPCRRIAYTSHDRRVWQEHRVLRRRGNRRGPVSASGAYGDVRNVAQDTAAHHNDAAIWRLANTWQAHWQAV